MVAAATLFSTTSAMGGECAVRPPQHEIVTAEGATIPADGGVLVAQTAESSALALTLPLDKWRLVDGKRRLAPTLRVLAPGLTVLAGGGDRLENARGNKLRAFVRGNDRGPALPPPTVKSVTHTQVFSRKSFTSVSVELVRPATADHFLVVFDKDGKVARSFGRAMVGNASILVYRAGECVLLPDGTAVTQPDDQITVAWVDRFGRMSPQSGPFKVVGREVMQP